MPLWTFRRCVVITKQNVFQFFYVVIAQTKIENFYNINETLYIKN